MVTYLLALARKTAAAPLDWLILYSLLQLYGSRIFIHITINCSPGSKVVTDMGTAFGIGLIGFSIGNDLGNHGLGNLPAHTQLLEVI